MITRLKLAKRLRRIADLLDVPQASLARKNKVPLDIWLFMKRVETYGVRTVLDIGANNGVFARWCAASLPNTQIHCFEPLPACHEALARLAESNPSIQIHRVALGDSISTVEMYENAYNPSSSLLPMLDRHRHLWPKTTETQRVKVPVLTLDSIAAEHGFSSPIFLKADVQGYEMHVLRGAENVLKQTAVVMLEVLFEPFYDGQTNLQTLINYFAERGFRFLEFADQRRLPPLMQAAYADAVFVNESFIQQT